MELRLRVPLVAALGLLSVFQRALMRSIRQSITPMDERSARWSPSTLNARPVILQQC